MPEHQGFERERLRYCEAMYSIEKERREIIERQAQFYFGIITLFMGLLILKKDVLDVVRLATAQPAPKLTVIIIYSELALFLLSLAASLFSILMVFKPERRHKPYPKKLITSLFSKDLSRSRPENHEVSSAEGISEVQFLRENALRYALAVEKNSTLNTKKSKWLIAAAASAFLLIFAYALLATSLSLSLLKMP